MKKIDLFKKRKELLKRINKLEIEAGITKPRVLHQQGGLLFNYDLLFGSHKTLSDKVDSAEESIKNIAKELKDLREYLDITYQNEPEKTVLEKKPKQKEQPKTWKDKIVGAIEEVVNENSDY